MPFSVNFCVYGEVKFQLHSFACRYLDLPAPFVASFSSLNCLHTLVEKSVIHRHMGLFLNSMISMFILMPV